MRTIWSSSSFSPLAFVFGLVFASAAWSADYQGAGPIPQKVVEEGAIKTDKDGKPDEHAKLRQEITDFKKKLPGLPPVDAVKGWLDLVERRAKLDPSSFR